MNITRKALLPVATITLLLTATFVKAQDHSAHKLKFPEINCINAKLPLHFSEVNYSAAHKPIPAPAVEKVKKILSEFYIEMGGDRNEEWTKVKDSYFCTLCVPFYNYQLYIVILQAPAPSQSHCKLFLYDPAKKIVSEKAVDYNVWAMYHIDNNKLIASDLTKQMHLKPADISQEGSETYPLLHLTRLNHNGTFNAMEEVIYSLNGVELDTFSFHSKTLR